jgi:hypothetical protein
MDAVAEFDPAALESAASALRRPAQLLALTAGCLFAGLFIAAVSVTMLGNRDLSGPVVRIDLPAPPPVHAASVRAPAQAAAPMALPQPAAITKPLYAGHALIADPALIENTPDGPLPRIADDGRKPMNAYAAPAAAGKMRIAIVVSGLGISAKETAAALAALPPAVTLAFAPYADDAQHWVSEARQSGHEVLLEVPMEPYDFPDSDPGPHTLRTALDESSNIQRLDWALTRFTGYVGVTNLLGERYLADAGSLSPAMTYLARRGLVFYDSENATGSAASDVASRVGAPFARSAGTVDTIETALEIDRRLSDLEAQARAHGSAAGSAFLYPVSVQRIAVWAAGLSGRGFVLVPISAIVSQPK